MAQTEHKDISVQRVNITTKNNYAKHIQSDFYTPQWFILTVSYKFNSETLKGHLSRKHYHTTLSEKRASQWLQFTKSTAWICIVKDYK